MRKIFILLLQFVTQSDYAVLNTLLAIQAKPEHTLEYCKSLRFYFVLGI
jgi:hypothetical protein